MDWCFLWTRNQEQMLIAASARIVVYEHLLSRRLHMTSSETTKRRLSGCTSIIGTSVNGTQLATSCPVATLLVFVIICKGRSVNMEMWL